MAGRKPIDDDRKRKAVIMVLLRKILKTRQKDIRHW